MAFLDLQDESVHNSFSKPVTRSKKSVRTKFDPKKKHLGVSLAYAAGVMDSDGSISAGRYKTETLGVYTYAVSLAVSQVAVDAVYWFAAEFGGTLSKRTHSNPKHKDQVVWNIYCREAAAVLELILPYLKIKKVRAEAAIKLARCARTKNECGNFGALKVLSEFELAQRERYARTVRQENNKSSNRAAICAKSLMEGLH